jgi:hypothetical protein
MGNRPTSTLCFGVRLLDGPQPWGPAGGDGGQFRDWLRELDGYQNPHEYPFTPCGDYKPGFSTHSANTEAYYDFLRAWEAQHRPLYCLCRHGSPAAIEYVLAPTADVQTTAWDEIRTLAPTFDLTTCRGAQLLAFCRRHGVATHGPAAWHLLAYYG